MFLKVPSGWVLTTTNMSFGIIKSAMDIRGDVLLDNPDHKEGLAPVCDHIHLIMNWEVIPLGDMHTHQLLKPEQVTTDTDIGSVPRAAFLKNLPPQYGGQ